jgi:hypothetical protein
MLIKLLARSVVAVLLLGGFCVSAQINPGEIDGEVTAHLRKKDLLAAIREAENSGTKEPRSLWWRLNLYVRVANYRKVAETVSELISISREQDKAGLAYQLSPVFEDKLFNDAALLQTFIQHTSTTKSELYGKLIDLCIANRASCDIRGFESFLRKRADESWRKISENDSYDWNGNVEARRLVAWQEKFGLDPGETRSMLTDDLRSSPSNLDAALRFIEFASNVQELEWVAEVFSSDVAYDYYELGEALARGRAYRIATESNLPQVRQIATRFLRKSLDIPFGEHDAGLIASRKFRFVSVAPQIKNYEKQLRFWTKTTLAEVYNSLGEPQHAQPLVEELVSLDMSDIVSHIPSQLAGAVQSGSGARVVESKILNEQALKQNTFEYWYERIAYYRGRKEAERVLESYKKGLAAVPFDLSNQQSVANRLSFINRFANFAGENLYYYDWRDRSDELKDTITAEAESFLKTEFNQTKSDLRYSLQLLEIIRRQNESDSLFRQIIASRPELLMRAAMIDVPIGDIFYAFLTIDEIPVAKKDAIVTALLGIAGKKDFVKALSLCDTFSNLNDHPKYAAQVLPILTKNLKTAKARYLSAKGDNAFELADISNKYEELLFDAYLAANDWRSAEKLVEERKPTRVYAPYDRLTLNAARNGAVADAIRYWKIKANFDRRNLTELDALARYKPVAAALREFYSKMKVDEPYSPIPDIALKTLK